MVRSEKLIPERDGCDRGAEAETDCRSCEHCLHCGAGASIAMRGSGMGQCQGTPTETKLTTHNFSSVLQTWLVGRRPAGASAASAPLSDLRNMSLCETCGILLKCRDSCWSRLDPNA